MNKPTHIPAPVKQAGMSHQPPGTAQSTPVRDAEIGASIRISAVVAVTTPLLHT